MIDRGLRTGPERPRQTELGIALLLALNLSATIYFGSTGDRHGNSKNFGWPVIDSHSSVPYTYDAELVKVVDGDTVDLHIDLGFEFWYHNQRMRLFGIDAPETRSKDLVEKKQGLDAKEWLANRLSGAEIVVKSIQNEAHGTDQSGGFGRWLAIIYADGKNVNEEMIQLGLVKTYEK